MLDFFKLINLFTGGYFPRQSSQGECSSLNSHFRSLLTDCPPQLHESLEVPGPPGEHAAAPPHQPVPHVGVCALPGQLPAHQPGAQVAVVGHALVAEDVVVRPPPEIRGKPSGVEKQRVEMIREVGRVWVLEGVNEGVRRENFFVVSAPKHDRYGV